MKKVLFILVIVLFILSLGLNGILLVRYQDKINCITLRNANLRETYETVHNVKEAQKISTGKGMKVAILGTYFGYDQHSNLYTAGKNFIADEKSFKKIKEHGYWMALTLKEIAPDVEIYALNVRDRNRDKEAEAIVKAIEWAIENNIDILTYSAAPFDKKNVEIIDDAVNNAVNNNIVTTFIHYPNPNNILAFGLQSYNDYYERKPDLRVLHYDYNTLILGTYKKYLEAGRDATDGDAIPYFSMSSMSPVLAGFIAMLKEVNNELTPDEYREILVKSSYNYNYNGKEISKVVDISRAIQYLKDNY